MAEKPTIPKRTNKKKKEPEDLKKKLRDIPEGSLQKALIRPGNDDTNPIEGDMVIFHCTTRTEKGAIMESSRSEHGGGGVPRKIILGKTVTLRALELGILSMTRGEVSILRAKPELHYADKNCSVKTPSDNCPMDEDLLFEIEVIDFFAVKVLTDDEGVVKKVLEEGEGWETAREPYEVRVSVRGRVPGNGKVLFCKEEFSFEFGKGEVPEGLEKGIGSMTRGEKSVVFVDKGYLRGDCGKMPEVKGVNCDVEFDVEVKQIIQVRDMVGDGKVIKRRIRDGTGEFPVDCPLHDSLLRIHYKGMLPGEGGRVFYDTRNDGNGEPGEGGRVFYDTRNDGNGEPLEFSSGEGMVPDALEMCVRLMLPNEVALVSSTSEYAYDKFPRPDDVPEGANVQWEIELLGFEMPRDWTGLSFDEIMSEADKIKDTGNRLFKEGKFELAKAKYEKLLKEFNHVNPQDDEEGKIFAEKRRALNLNMAACHQKLYDYKKCIEACNKVIEEAPWNAKAVYRRGMAYMSSGDFDEARSDFNKMKEIDKSSEPDAATALAKLKKKEQEIERKEREQFKGLFDRKPGEITEGERANSDESNHSHEHLEDHADFTQPNEVRPEQVDRAVMGWTVSSIWAYGKRKLSSYGVNRCSIL